MSHDDHHHHGHSHDHSHGHQHRDNNLRAAYVHVVADAATSVLAIAALLAAMVAQWTWADPLVGIIGAVVIATWAWGLIRDSGAVLLDVNSDKNLGRDDPRAAREHAATRSPICICGRSAPATAPP